MLQQRFHMPTQSRGHGTLINLVYLARGERTFVALKLLGQFFANNRQLGRRFDADAHATVANFDHGDHDLVADKNPLADFSTEN
jgi:hypothetical protein